MKDQILRIILQALITRKSHLLNETRLSYLVWIHCNQDPDMTAQLMKEVQHHRLFKRMIGIKTQRKPAGYNYVWWYLRPYFFKVKENRQWLLEHNLR